MNIDNGLNDTTNDQNTCKLILAGTDANSGEEA